MTTSEAESYVMDRRKLLVAAVSLPLAALPVQAETIYPKPDGIERFPTGWVEIDGQKYLPFWWLPMWLQTEEERGKRTNNCLFPPGHPLRYVREAFPPEPYRPGSKQVGNVRWA